MRTSQIALSIAMAILTMVISRGVRAQQTHLGLGYHSVGESFSENIGTSWGFNSRGVSFNFGGGGLQSAPGAPTSAFLPTVRPAPSILPPPSARVPVAR